MHRRITILADRGDTRTPGASSQMRSGTQPDNPMLATLELTLLLGEKNYGRMRERGEFWIARLGRDREHDYGDLIAHIK